MPIKFMDEHTIEPISLNSTEWLTTGQMIDRLRVGECAECINVPGIKGMNKSASYQVKKVKDGHIKWCDGMDTLIMAKFIVDEAKWRIIPQFVSFEEAMKALHEEKIVVFYSPVELNPKI
jgi:hypothetical protein